MGHTRQAAPGPTPKAAPTTQNNGIKKAIPPAKGTEQQIYIVTRQTINPYNDPEHDIKGTYKTVAAANAAARADLTNEWDEDTFATYTVEEVDGMVHVVATFPDGEEMVVMVERAEVKKEAGGGVKKTAVNCAVREVATRRAAAKAPEPPSEITLYHVIREQIDYHNDPDGSLQHREFRGSYLSRRDANAAARRDLLDEWDSDFFEAHKVKKTGGLVTITADCPEGEVFNVWVEKGKLNIGDRAIVGLGNEEEGSESSDDDDTEDESGEESM